MARNSDRIYVARSGTSATVTTPVAMVAATAKSVVSVLGTAGTTISLIRVQLSFDGVTATAVPALVEIGVTSALGTVTAFTPVQIAGRALASACSAGYNASVEPTYTKIAHGLYVPVLMGLVLDYSPLGDELQCDVSQGIAIRVTAPAIVNCLASLTYCE